MTDRGATRRVARKVAGGRSPRETTGSDDETNRTPEGCQINALNLRDRCLAPLRGAVMTSDFSGGLRRLRPPATFLATLRVAPRSLNYIGDKKHYPALYLLTVFAPNEFA